jgi:hypothetical protein
VVGGAVMSALPSRERLSVVGVALFGGTLPATRIAVSAIDPMALTALRTTLAGLGLAKAPWSWGSCR